MFFASIVSELSAAEEPAQLSLTDVSYSCYKAEFNPSKFYYYINVTLYNSGDEPSIPIDVMIIEDGHSICPEEFHNVSIDAQEQKTFTFNWCTPFTSKAIDIAYIPSDLDLLPTEYNSGNQSIIITYNLLQQNEQTPGFELAIIISSIIFLFIFFRKNRRR